MVKVLIVAEDPYVRAGLNTLLHSEEGIEICGMLAITHSRTADITSFGPDVILLDAAGGIGVEREMIEFWAGSEWPILALDLDPTVVQGEWPTNLSVLNDRAGGDKISAAIHAVAWGLQVFDRETIPGSSIPPFDGNKRILEPLTEREMEVLHKIAEGSTNRAIAQSLGISENTVKFHVNAIFQKLQAQSRTEAVVQAVRSGVLPL